MRANEAMVNDAAQATLEIARYDTSTADFVGSGNVTVTAKLSDDEIQDTFFAMCAASPYRSTMT